MVQWLRELAVLSEDPSSILIICIGSSQPSITSIPQDLLPFSDFCGHKGMVSRYIHRQNTHIHFSFKGRTVGREVGSKSRVLDGVFLLLGVECNGERCIFLCLFF